MSSYSLSQYHMKYDDVSESGSVQSSIKQLVEGFMQLADSLTAKEFAQVDSILNRVRSRVSRAARVRVAEATASLAAPGSKEADLLKVLQIQHASMLEALSRVGLPTNNCPSWEETVLDGLTPDQLKPEFLESRLILVPPVSVGEMIEAINRSGLSKVVIGSGRGIDEELSKKPDGWRILIVNDEIDLAKSDELFPNGMDQMVLAARKERSMSSWYSNRHTFHGAAGMSQYEAERYQDDIRAGGVRYHIINSVLDDALSPHSAIDDFSDYLALYIVSLHECRVIDSKVPVLLRGEVGRFLVVHSWHGKSGDKELHISGKQSIELLCNGETIPNKRVKMDVDIQVEKSLVEKVLGV